MEPLNRHTVSCPSRPISILQIGSGNFLRAFFDWMVQQSNEAALTNHGIAMAYATHRPGPRTDHVADQDGLFHVCLEGVRNGQQVRRVDLVEAVQEVIDPWRDTERYREIITSRDLKVIVSNTTEAGITYREEPLDVDVPESFPAQTAKLLHDRFTALGGDPDTGLAIVACELIENNGETLRQMVHDHARRANWSDEFVAWLDTANSFYDTLVDRIVAGYPTDQAEEISREIGFEDRGLVKGELFSLWVIGGDGRLQSLLPLDRIDLGVRFVPRGDVAPFRNKKVRVLNGCHTAMAQFGLLLGHETVDQAYGDPTLRTFLNDMVSDEVLPTIQGDPADLRAFADAILERFDNPALHHRLADISLNSVAKWRSRNLPVVVDRWTAGMPADRQVLSLGALLLAYSCDELHPGLTPRDEPGMVDGIRAALSQRDGTEGVAAALSQMGLDQLLEAEGFNRLVTQTTEALRQLRHEGVEATLLSHSRR